MDINVIIIGIGPGRLTTEHAASSHGLPVIVDCNGLAYGPGDVYTSPETGQVAHRLGDHEISPVDRQQVLIDISDDDRAAAIQAGWRLTPGSRSVSQEEVDAYLREVDEAIDRYCGHRRA